MRKIFFIGVLLISFGCASTPKPTPNKLSIEVYAFKASYDSVWSASLKALSDYKLLVTNKDAGQIETDFKVAPSEKYFFFAGGQKVSKDTKWKMKVALVSISSGKKSGHIKVSVEKEEYRSPGFLQAYQRTKSNLITEQALIYRISRNIKLEKILAGLTTTSTTD